MSQLSRKTISILWMMTRLNEIWHILWLTAHFFFCWHIGKFHSPSLVKKKILTQVTFLWTVTRMSWRFLKMCYTLSIVWPFDCKERYKKILCICLGVFGDHWYYKESILQKLKRSIQEVNILNFAVTLLILMWVWLTSIISSLLKILYMLVKSFIILQRENTIIIINSLKKIISCKLIAMRSLRYIWVIKYRTTSPDNLKSPSSKWPSLYIFDQFFTKDNRIERHLKHIITNDEFKEYCSKPRDLFLFSLPLLQWWFQYEGEYHKLTQWVLDAHSMAATLAECERLFCLERPLVAPWQNPLLDDMIKTNEYWMVWKRLGFFEDFQHDNYSLMVFYLSKPATIREKPKICWSFWFMIGVDKFFRESFYIDHDLSYWIIQADLREEVRPFGIAERDFLREKSMVFVKE